MQQPSEELNTTQLKKLLDSDAFAGPLLQGVFARDQLPSKIPFPSCLIVNTHEMDKPGEHWLALFYNQKGKCSFFDSYGLPPSVYGLDSFVKRTPVSSEWNRVQYQPIYSKACGYYCFLFLLLKCRNINFKHINTNELL